MIKRTRKALGITQAQLAEKLGVSLQSVKAYEQGRRDINRAGLAVRRNWEALRCKKQ